MRGALRVCLIVAGLLATGVAPVLAQQAVQVRARAGWSGWVVPGVWIPLTVDVQASLPVDGTLVVEIPPPSGGRPMVFRQAVRLPAGGPRSVALEVVLPAVRHAPVVRLEAGALHAQAVADVRPAAAVDGVILAVSQEAAGLEQAATVGRLGPAYVGGRQLPDRWQGYGGVAAVVLRDLDPTELTSSQQEALAQWVAQGGHLVLTGAGRLLALRAPWLDRLLPATPAAVVTVGPADLPGLPAPMPAALLRPRRGVLAFPGPDRALVARWRYGAGTVTVWGWDAFSPQVRTWPGQLAFWREVLQAPSAPPVVGNLADVLPATRPLPVGVQGVLAVLSAVYIAVARAVLRRAGPRRYGWAAALALSAVATSALYGFALSVRTAATGVVQVSVAERLPGTAWARVRGAVAVYAPYGGRLGLRAPPGAVFLPAGHLPVAFDGPQALSGEVPAGDLRVGVQQMVEFPVDGTVRERPDGLEVTIRNPSRWAIDAPRVVRAGQVAALPGLSAGGTSLIDPTLWRPVQRSPSPPARARDRLLEEVLVALAARPGSWLVGWTLDRRVAVRWTSSRPAEVHHLVVVPLASQP